MEEKAISRDHLVMILRELIAEQSEGEWGIEMINKDAEIFAERIFSAINPVSE